MKRKMLAKDACLYRWSSGPWAASLIGVRGWGKGVEFVVLSCYHRKYFDYEFVANSWTRTKRKLISGFGPCVFWLGEKDCQK